MYRDFFTLSFTRKANNKPHMLPAVIGDLQMDKTGFIAGVINIKHQPAQQRE